MARTVDTRMQVDIEGMREFRKHLKGIDKSLVKEIGRMHKALAEDVVMPGVRDRAGESRSSLSGGSTSLGSAGARDIKPKGTQKAAQIIAGKKTPYFGGHEWGSKSYGQFPSASKEGYIIRPAIAEKQPEIIEKYGAALDAAVKPAFPD